MKWIGVDQLDQSRLLSSLNFVPLASADVIRLVLQANDNWIC